MKIFGNGDKAGGIFNWLTSEICRANGSVW